MIETNRKKEHSKLELEEFPGYTCYLFVPKDFKFDLTQQSFDNRKVSFKFENRYSRRFYKTCCVLPYRYPTYGPHTTALSCKDDVLLIHPQSTVPRTLIANGAAYNERGISTPTKIVVPNNYPRCVLKSRRIETGLIFLVNDEARTVFAVSSYTAESATGGSLQQWKHALYDSPDIFECFLDIIEGFTMPFGVKQFTVVEDLPDLDKVLIWGLIPKDRVVHESNLYTGTDEPTVDMLYSAYMMLQSLDDQIVETAFNMLARSKFSSASHIIKWLLRGNYQASRYRNRSTAFKWMYTQCCDLTTTLMLPAAQKDIAIELIRKITNNGIDFENGVMQINETKWLQNDEIRLLASKV